MQNRRTQPRNSRGAFTKVNLIGSASRALFVPLFVVAGVACSSAGTSDPTPVVRFKITPASGTYTTAPSAMPTVVSAKSPSASKCN